MAAAVGWPGAGRHAEAPMSDELPHVVIVVVDCFRPDACPLSGGQELTGWPKLRARSTVFTQAISSASNTPVCFASLLSGQYSFRHGVRTIAGPRIAPGTATLATVLRAAGYRTCAYLTGPMLSAFGLDEGFEVYEHRPQETNIYGQWGRRFTADFGRHFTHPRPAFVLLHLFELHAKRATNGVAVKPGTAEEYRVAWRQLDAKLDALLAQVPPGALVVLTGDHGEQIGRLSDRTPWGHVIRNIRENLRLRRRPVDWKGHGFHVFEDLVRMPLVLCGPGVPQGRLVGDQVRQIDIMPTVLELAGLRPPQPTHGRSLAPLLRGEELPHEAAYVESGRDDPPQHWHGLRKDGWKYVEHPRWGMNVEAAPQLYNLADDPRERRNVIGANVQRAVAMRRELDALVHGGGQAPSEGAPMAADDQAKLAEQLKALGYI